MWKLSVFGGDIFNIFEYRRVFVMGTYATHFVIYLTKHILLGLLQLSPFLFSPILYIPVLYVPILSLLICLIPFLSVPNPLLRSRLLYQCISELINPFSPADTNNVFANSVNPDEPSRQNLNNLSFCFNFWLRPPFGTMVLYQIQRRKTAFQKLRDGNVVCFVFIDILCLMLKQCKKDCWY